MQIILKLTTACNLNCIYCSEGDQEVQTLSKDVFCKLVDELPELLEHIHDNTAEFLFHGGEPMLYGRDNLLNLMNYAKARLTNYKVQFLIQTNGTLIDENWIKFFKTEDIKVGISLDGYPELHDRNRRTKKNEPTAELILSNIKLIREAGMNVGTLMVLNSTEQIDADKLFDFIREYGLQPKIHSVIACGRAANREDTEKIYSTYVEMMKKLLQRALEDDKTEIIQPLDELINAILGIAQIRECSFNGSCSKNFICIYPDGEAGFCGRDNLSRLLTYGNLKDNSLIELYNSVNAEKIRARQEYLKTHDCKSCADWELCHGGCAFEAINAFGTLNAKYNNCAERKEFIHWLRIEGLKMLKAALIRAKTKYRKSLKIKKQIFREIDDLQFNEVANDGRT